MNKKCKICGHDIDEELDFCPNCGQKYVASEKEHDEITKAMNEIYGSKPNEEIDEAPKRSATSVVAALVVFLILAVTLVFVYFQFFSKPADEPNIPDPPVVDQPTNNPNENPVTPPVTDEPKEDPGMIEWENKTDTTIEGLSISRVEFVDEGDETFTVTIYYDYAEEGLSIYLMDPSGMLSIGPVSLPKGASNAYFFLGKATLKSVTELDFQFTLEDGSKATHIVKKSEFEDKLK